jgi:hypothetical protein
MSQPMVGHRKEQPVPTVLIRGSLLIVSRCCQDRGVQAIDRDRLARSPLWCVLFIV